MALVGKHLGQVLGPQDKMPFPVPPTAKLDPFMKRLENLIRVKIKGKFMPTVHATVGTEEMKDEQIVTNADKVIESIVDNLPGREGNLRSVYLKMSMGPSVKVV
jgi:large subunit ribosomal protein L1